MGQLANRAEVAGGDRRNDDRPDPGGGGGGDDGAAVGVELRGVEMAMRVDPHGFG